jgi:hypothetical protein
LPGCGERDGETASLLLWSHAGRVSLRTYVQVTEAEQGAMAGRPEQRWRIRLAGAAAGCAAGLAAAPALAQDFHQVWLGGLAHNVAGGAESGTADVLLEVETAKPRALRPIGAPRLSLSLAANPEGHSNLASFGLVWDRRLTGRLSATFGFGLGFSNGLVEPRSGLHAESDRENRLLLGSHVLFREAVGLDWRLTRRWSIGVEYIHASNGDVLGPHDYNSSLNQAGVRLGYRLD